MRERLITVIICILIMLAVFSTVSGKVGVEKVPLDEFSTNVRVNDDLGEEHQRKPDIAVDDMGVIYTVWSDQRILGIQACFFSKSTDGGATFSPNTNVNTHAFAHPVEPAIAARGDGELYVIWTDWRGGAGNCGDLFFSKSSDGGENWSYGRRVDNGSVGSAQIFPDIAVDDNGVIYAVWQDNRSGDNDIWFSKCLDGVFWSEDIRVNDNTTNEQLYPRLDVNSDGSIICVVWSDERNGNTDVFYSASTDGGVSFEPNIRVDDGPGSSAQGALELIIDLNGILYTAWNDDRNGDTDIYFSKSIDRGGTWIPGVKVSDDLSNKSQSGGEITVDPTGSNIYISWNDFRNDNWDVYFSMSDDGGNTFCENMKVNDDTTDLSQDSPAIATDDSGNCYIIWEDWRKSIPPVIYDIDVYFATLKRSVYTNISLNHGWNLISLPLVQTKLNGTHISKASDVFNVTNCTELAIWNSDNQSYTIYIPGFNLPTDPENFAIGEDDAIFVWIDRAESFSVDGYDPGSRNVSLKAGWNMVGYKGLTVLDVETTWADQVSAGPYDDICYYENGSFVHYIFPGTDMQLVPTRGYFVWSDVDTWLTY